MVRFVHKYSNGSSCHQAVPEVAGHSRAAQPLRRIVVVVVKMNRTLMLMVFLGALFTREAQAFYNPSAGRWLSRDPLSESGDKNLYGFVGNDAASSYDYLGQRMEPPPRPPAPPREPPNTDPVPSGECRIQVCCGSVSGTVWEHCYVRFDDENGSSGCRAGPSRRTQGSGGSGSQGGVPSNCKQCCGFWGTVNGGCGAPGSPEMAGDFGRPGQSCVTVDQSAAMCGVMDCIRRKIQEMNRQCVRYRVNGPNSNSAIYTALQDCMGAAPPKPAGSQTPGWRPINNDDKRCN